MAADPSSIPRQDAPTLYSLQVLRGVAALLVLLYHYAFYLRAVLPGRDLGAILLSEGYMGVDVFFLISGFIIVHSTRRPAHATPAAFALRRLFRVVPVAQVATLVYAVILPNWPSATQVIRSLLFLPQTDFDPPIFGYPVVHQEWTLAYELFFYGVFAAALVVSHRRRVLVASLLLGASVVAGQLLLGGPPAVEPETVFLPPAPAHPLVCALLGEVGNPLLLEFVVGMLLAEAYERYGARLRTGAVRRAAQAAAVLLLAAFGVSFCSQKYPGHGLLHRGAGAVALVGGALLLELTFPPPGLGKDRPRWLAAALGLGTLSYSLYLVHLGIAERSLRFIAQHALGKEVAGLGGFLALLPTALLFAWVLHVWVEQPCIRLGRRLAHAVRPRFSM